MEIIIALVTVTIIIIMFLLWFKNDLQKRQKEDFKNIHNELMNESMTKLSQISKDALKSDKETITTDLKNKKEVMESMVKSIQEDLEKRHKELVESRTENMKYFGDIKRQIEEHQKATKDLDETASKLARVMSNNQVRGEWGEKILEDILVSAGLEKGVHYKTQETMDSGVRPDVIIMLPEKRTINIDAKFPLAAILKMTDAEDKTHLTNLKKQFETDVKAKLRDITKREYINSEHGTLDFAIMFVPNEVVFTYINKEFPALVEEAFSKKIIIASPFSIYAIARTIMQGYRNFYYEQNIKDVLVHITAFKDNFERFTGEFEKLGRSFETTYKDYQQISDTRVKQMNRSFKNIEEAEKSSNIKKPTLKEPDVVKKLTGTE